MPPITSVYDNLSANAEAAIAYRTGLSAADAANLAVRIVGLTIRQTEGRTLLYVAGRFTNTIATVDCVVVLLDGSNQVMGKSSRFTLTADATLLMDGTLFGGEQSEPIDIEGAAAYEVRLVGAVSAGTVDLHAWRI